MITAVSQREIQSCICKIQVSNDKTSNDLNYEDALLCYEQVYNDVVFGRNLSMWRDSSLKTVFEYEYFKLQRYLNGLNEISLADPKHPSFSSKLDKLRSEMNDHANKLTQNDKSLGKWKKLAEKSNDLRLNFDDLKRLRSDHTIRHFCL